MQKLSLRKKLNIVRQFFSGLSYDEITSKTGTSKGSVANVIAELKAGVFPEAGDLGEQLDLLRELSVEIKRSKLSPGQCAAGLIVLDRIKECGLTPANIDRLPLIFKSAGSEAEAQEFVDLVHSICEVQQRTGLSIEGLDGKVHELEKKASNLESVVKKCDAYSKQLAELTGQRDELATMVSSNQEKYDLLNPRVKDLEKREQDLLRRNKGLEDGAEKAEAVMAALKEEKKRLVEMGLSLEDLAELSQESQSIARRHKITSSELRSRLLKELKNLDKALGLETLIGRLQAELKEQKQVTALAQQELDSLKADIGSLKQEKARLEASINHTREEMGNEIAKIVPSARDAINQWQTEMQAGHDEALVEVRRLRDETIEAGKEIGRYEQIVQTNQWLGDLLALIRRDEAIEARQVRVIVLPVLRSFAAWLKRNEAHNMRFSLLPITVGNLIDQVEQWQA